MFHQLKIDQSGGGSGGNKSDYDLKQNQQQPMRSSPDSPNLRNASSVLQNPYAESNVANTTPKATGLPQPKSAVAAKKLPTEERKQNGTNGKAVHTTILIILKLN